MFSWSRMKVATAIFSLMVSTLRRMLCISLSSLSVQKARLSDSWNTAYLCYAHRLMSVAGLGRSLLFWEQSDHSIFHTFPERCSGKLTCSFWVIPSFAPLRDPSCSVSLVIFSGSVALWVERQNASWRRYREIFGVRSQWHTYSQHSSVNMLWPRFHNNMAALCEFSLPNLFENVHMTCGSINASGELGCSAFFVFPIGDTILVHCF